MRPNAHIVRRRFSGLQVVVTVPKHIAQAVGMWNDGYVSFQVNEKGQLILTNHTTGAATNGDTPNQLSLDRPTPQPA